MDMLDHSFLPGSLLSLLMEKQKERDQNLHQLFAIAVAVTALSAVAIVQSFLVKLGKAGYKKTKITDLNLIVFCSFVKFVD